jgi:hypothetical protein
MEENVGYGVHLARGTRQEAAADITMEENMGYGVHLARGTRQEAAADIGTWAMESPPQPPQDESYEYIL